MLKEADLVKGTPLMWEYKKKSYPVVFLEMISKGNLQIISVVLIMYVLYVSPLA